MKKEYHKWWSPALKQDMSLNIYGHSGKPVVLFPTRCGRYTDFDDFGMIESVRSLIDEGRMTAFCVETIDRQTWFNTEITPNDRAARYDDYESYLIHEVLPLIHHRTPGAERIMTAGCDMGAYHAVNFMLRHPMFVDKAMGLSGLYGSHYFIGDYMSEKTYYYFPLSYLPGLSDPFFINALKSGELVLCSGQGSWERCQEYDCISDTISLSHLLNKKDIPCWLDLWGEDVSHDWVWWRKQLFYFLNKMM